MIYSKISITVIIPTYNRDDTIVRCINSILTQTHQPNEIIIIDDNSNDDTVNKINSISSPLIKLIELNSNHGAQYARNRGIEAATSEWIAFLDSDDEWLPFKLELQIDLLKTNDYDRNIVIHGNCFRYNHSTKAKNKWDLNTAEGEDAHRQLLSNPGPMFQAMLIPKNKLEEIGLLDVKVPSYQEWDTAIMLSKVCKFIHIKEPIFIYHFHDGVTISKNKKNDIQGYAYIVNKNKNDMTMRAIAHHYSILVDKSFQHGEWSSAIFYLHKIDMNPVFLWLKVSLIRSRLHPSCIKFYLKRLIFG
jgi:glycosyltransferase involved in cell wall biosynthesis